MGIVLLFACLNPRPPAQVKRPNTAVKVQRKDGPAMQHQHRGPTGKGQPNPKSDRVFVRDSRNPKVKEEKVGGKVLYNILNSSYSHFIKDLISQEENTVKWKSFECILCLKWNRPVPTLLLILTMFTKLFGFKFF